VEIGVESEAVNCSRLVLLMIDHLIQQISMQISTGLVMLISLPLPRRLPDLQFQSVQMQASSPAHLQIFGSS
jgi:hypothetical protein